MHNKEIDTIRVSKQPIRGEVFFDGAFGRRMYDYILVPVFDAHGEVQCVAGTTRDVTERYQAQETLKQNEIVLKQNERSLKDADQRKDEFLAMLAHELRNPLAPISAATHIMTLGEFNEARVRKSSQIIERQVKHMVGLVDDLLDVSRVTRGLVTIDRSPQDMTAVISNSIEQVKPLLESKQHHLTVHLQSGPVMVMGDYKRLVQIVTNILNNSAKYTPEEGHITVAVKTVDEQVIITIADDGIGIIAEEQESIFELFAQAKRSSDRSQGGLGLGLALVRSMLKLHDGSVRCDSAGLGLGSQFTITLPLHAHEALAEPQTGSSQIQTQPAQNILVVDDNVDAAETIANLLQLVGHEVSVCHDPLEALELVDSLSPAICILDIGLPNMDGHELARKIRAKPAMQHALLVAVTGYSQESDRIQSLKSGFDFHLAKPVDLDELLRITSRPH